MKNKTNLNLLRLYSIPIVIRYFFIIASISILLIELIFKKTPAPNPTFYKAGDIYLKLCYSLTAAIIFYFINQHLPREKKKLKSIIYIFNKVFYINKEINYLLIALNKSFEDIKFSDITEHMIKDACNLVNPHTKVISMGESSIPFESWFEYFSYKSVRLKGLINDLLPLYDIIDPELMATIYLIEHEASVHLHVDKKRIGNITLTYWWSSFLRLAKDSDYAMVVLYKKYKNILKEHRYTSIKKRQGERYFSR